MHFIEGSPPIFKGIFGSAVAQLLAL